MSNERPLGADVPDAEVTALGRLASELARMGGELALQGLAAVEALTNKSSLTDLVTEHDQAVERRLVELIAEHRPDDGILGEEGARATGTSGLIWYLDPIDGTTNFVHGHPLWATSVGVGDDSAMLAGAVYAPAMDELFATARGGGATLNGARISSSGCSDVSMAIIATGFGYTSERRLSQAGRITSMIGRIADIRRGGSAALDLCYAACGRVDAFYEEYLNVWDRAAGELIATEAGCIAGPIGGSSDPSGLCVAPPAIFDDLRQLIAANV
ncbi:MAG: inositol monophosphatase [Actinomycetota bacterium]|nr:inositol monophosphatase [Actinomycetota bacterium]